MQLFGGGKSSAEKLKEHTRAIKRSVRDIDRERTNLERQEKKLMADIKKEAKEGRVDSAKIMAKDLVRTRGYIKKMYKMKSHMEAVSLRLQTMQSSAQMVSRGSACKTVLRCRRPCTHTCGRRWQAQSMKGVVKVMGTMNKKVLSHCSVARGSLCCAWFAALCCAAH